MTHPNEVFYKPFNMDGKRFYSFRVGNAEFFALDSNYMDPAQLDWLRVKLREIARGVENLLLLSINAALYSNCANARFGSGPLRKRLEPIFLENGVSVGLFSGHDHTYERFQNRRRAFYILSRAARGRCARTTCGSRMTPRRDSTPSMPLCSPRIAGDELHFPDRIAKWGHYRSGSVRSPEIHRSKRERRVPLALKLRWAAK